MGRSQLLPAADQSPEDILRKWKAGEMFSVSRFPGSTSIECGQRVEMQREGFRIPQPGSPCLLHEASKCCKACPARGLIVAGDHLFQQELLFADLHKGQVFGS